MLRSMHTNDTNLTTSTHPCTLHTQIYFGCSISAYDALCRQCVLNVMWKLGDHVSIVQIKCDSISFHFHKFFVYALFRDYFQITFPQIFSFAKRTLTWKASIKQFVSITKHFAWKLEWWTFMTPVSLSSYTTKMKNVFCSSVNAQNTDIKR